ncbi:MAG: hypothetical protein NVS1B11_12940 [Terriglobales bacterium]
MGLLDFFKDEVFGSKVLVCSLDHQFDEFVKTDSQIYKLFYPSTEVVVFDSGRELIGALRQRYDIIHFFGDVLSSDTPADSFTGAELLRECCTTDVKLLWLASSNPPDSYINSFKARGKRINLVMTLDRNGSAFPIFLEKLLFRMFHGDPMPVAWADLCPQIPKYSHPDTPSSVFFAGRGRVKLR